jgi:hypothetical protein
VARQLSAEPTQNCTGVHQSLSRIGARESDRWIERPSMVTRIPTVSRIPHFSKQHVKRKMNLLKNRYGNCVLCTLLAYRGSNEHPTAADCFLNALSATAGRRSNLPVRGIFPATRSTGSNLYSRPLPKRNFSLLFTRHSDVSLFRICLTLCCTRRHLPCHRQP